MSSPPDRNLALELVRVTEAAALGAARWIGRGDKEAADQAAVDGMHAVLHTIRMDGVVVIGEGRRTRRPMLHNGEHVGDGSPPEVEIAVDPLEGRAYARSACRARSPSSRSPSAARCSPGADRLHEKMAAGEQYADLLDLDEPLGAIVAAIAERKGAEPNDVMAVVLDRPRHEEGIAAIRAAGGRCQLITDGDVSGALNACAPDRAADFLWGIGGTPEGVISAAAIKCIGGALVGRLAPRDDAERQAAVDAGYDLDRVLTHDDLVKGEDVFFSATGVTDGDVLQGVRYEGSRGASTESLVMRSRSGTVRRIQSRHDRSSCASSRATGAAERRAGQRRFTCSHPISLSVRSAITRSRPLPQRTVSRRLSRASMRSLPAPPSSRSLPLPPHEPVLAVAAEERSLPPPPERQSSPAPPRSTSSPARPRSRSPNAVPISRSALAAPAWTFAQAPASGPGGPGGGGGASGVTAPLEADAEPPAFEAVTEHVIACPTSAPVSV